MYSSWLRLGWSTGAVLAFGTVACGSSDSSRKAVCTAETCPDASDGSGGRTNPGAGGGGAGTGGASASGGAGGGSGGLTGGGGAGPDAGGSSTTDASTTDASDAGTTDASTTDASDASTPPSCVIPPPDAGATPCAPGTADCDANPNDCETNTATDALSCGRCDRICGATAACNNGLCGATVILDPPAGVASNWCGGAFTSTTAYMITCWGNNNLSEVRSVPLEPGASVDGTRIQHYTDVSVVALRGIVIDGPDVVYGLESQPGVPSEVSNLWKFPLDADGPEDVTVGVAMEVGMRFDDLKLVGDTYYWESNEYTSSVQNLPAAIYRRGKSDAAPTLLVSTLGIAYNLQVTPTRLVWLETRTPGDARVYSAPLAGAAIDDVEEVGVASSGSYLTQQGPYVYWTVKLPPPNGKILRLHTENPAAVPEEVAINLDRPEGIRTDSGHVYFKQADALYRVPLCGGFPEQLSPAVPAHDAQATTIFHVDDRYVYFAADPGFGTSTLVRVAK